MYLTVKSNAMAEITEKRSRFIANIYYVETKEEAEKTIKECKKTYNDARHNVYAYRILENSNIISKSSDDGEPSGTAGAPLLGILEGRNLINLLVVVTRYFGGTLLGTGGLVRAYSESLEQALSKVEVIPVVEGNTVKVTLNYDELERLNYYCKQNDIEIKNAEYLENIEILLEVEKDKLEEFKVNISKISSNLPAYDILDEILIRKKH